MPRTTPAPETVLLVQLGRIGDFILATCVLRALAGARPPFRVSVLASAAAASLVRDHPLVADVIRFDKNPARLAVLLARLRGRRFDWWLDPKDHRSREGLLLARCARATSKVGFAPPGTDGVFHHRIPSAEANAALHVASRNLHVLAPMGFDVGRLDPRPELFSRDGDERAFERFLSESAMRAGEYALVHLSARHKVRHWPPAAWEELLRAMTGDGLRVVITADPAESGLAAGLAGMMSGTRHYPTSSILALLPAVRHARLVVSPDTSVVHIASAFDRPLLGLYSNIPWNTRKFAPLSTHSRVVTPAAEEGLLHEIEPKAVVTAYRDLVTELSA